LPQWDSSSVDSFPSEISVTRSGHPAASQVTFVLRLLFGKLPSLLLRHSQRHAAGVSLAALISGLPFTRVVGALPLPRENPAADQNSVRFFFYALGLPIHASFCETEKAVGKNPRGCCLTHSRNACANENTQTPLDRNIDKPFCAMQKTHTQYKSATALFIRKTHRLRVRMGKAYPWGIYWQTAEWSPPVLGSIRKAVRSIINVGGQSVKKASPLQTFFPERMQTADPTKLRQIGCDAHSNPKRQGD
jgi:hypothetical protein